MTSTDGATDQRIENATLTRTGCPADYGRPDRQQKRIAAVVRNATADTFEPI